MPSPNESQRVQAAAARQQTTQTQNESKLEIIKTMNTTSTSSDFAALIGIDWASQQHALCLYDCATGKRESSTLEQTPEAIAQWARALKQRFAGKKIPLCLEQSKGALMNALLDYPFLSSTRSILPRPLATVRPSKPAGPKMIPLTRKCASN
jgi:hypothetical protein